MPSPRVTEGLQASRSLTEVSMGKERRTEGRTTKQQEGRKATCCAR